MEIRIVNGFKVFFINETTSTMDIAKKKVGQETEFVIVARRQTEGRGRLGRKWISDEGGLWASIVWKDIEKIVNYLFIVVALAILETLRFYGIDGKIKLPNDIYCGRKKIAGVLIETSGRCAIIGIGININNHINDKMDEATSCVELIGHKLSLNDVLSTLLENLARKRRDFEADPERFLNNIKGNLIK